jgi:general stress protein YciG
MDPERQRQIAAMGGRSQGRKNNPGNFANNPERAAAAGRKGGRA